MSADEVWVTIVLLTLVVILLRNAFLLAPRAWLPRGIFERALRHAPLAALAALVMPEVLYGLLTKGNVPLSAGGGSLLLTLAVDPRVASALLLIAAARLVGNPVVAIVSAAALYAWMTL